MGVEVLLASGPSVIGYSDGTAVGDGNPNAEACSADVAEARYEE